MKRALLVLIALVFVGSICFAQQQPAKEEAKTVIGKVVSVTLADPAKGIASSVVDVADDMGKTTKVTVDSSVKVLDKALNAITPDQLKIGQKVEVKQANDKTESIKVAE